MNKKKCFTLLQNSKNIEQLKRIHAQAITLGLLDHHQHLSCKLLNNYSKFNKPTEALKTFSHIKHPDIVSWTSLITLYLQINQPFQALCNFSNLLTSGLKPDSFSVVGALSACGRVQSLSHGKMVHGMIVTHDLECETVVGNALIDMYSRNGEIGLAQLVFQEMGMNKDVVSWTSLLHGFIKCNDLVSARWFFDQMPQRNAVSWTAMITGYVQGGKPIEALGIFQQMKCESNHLPTATTIVAVLSGCADIGALDLGRSIHGYVEKMNLYSKMDATMYNALMDMYVKSGSLVAAENIFAEIGMKDKFSWTTMISGFAVHGDGSRAIRVFYDMLKSGMDPNEVTFVAVLSACSHAGLIDEGRKWFDKMSRVYMMEYKIEHYGCMVDLLGRAGCIEEAREIIERMRIEPDAVIWRSLFSASLVHGNLKLAETAGKKIIELEPDDDGVYMLLWNMYCSENQWGDASKTRKMMKDRKIKKQPGCSWVEVNGVVHEFVADDNINMHCLNTDIYSTLEGIAEQIKLTEKDM